MVESSRSQAPIVAADPPQVPDEVEVARKSLASFKPGDAVYISKLESLSSALLSRFALLGNPDDIDEVVNRKKQVLELVPPGHSSHLGALSNAGNVLTKRFKLCGDPGDLAEAISYFEAAIESCAPEHPSYVPLVGNLSNGLLHRYRSHGEVADLDQIVEKSSYALSICLPQTSHRDQLFNNMATALSERFQKLGDKGDLDAALVHYQTCLDLRPPGHPSRYTVLRNLAESMVIRFEADGQLQDLESAANHYVSALQLLSPGQEGFVDCFVGLGLVYSHLFYVQGDTEKLQMSIGCYQTAMEHSKAPDLQRSRVLDNYGIALQNRYKLFGNIGDLDQAILFLTTSLGITPPTYSGRPVTLFSLGTALLFRYNATSNVADLDSSIEKIASAVQLTGPGYHQRPTMLSLYGSALSARFKSTGDTNNLDLAASTSKEALALASPQEMGYASIVAELSVVLFDCFFYLPENTDNAQTIIEYCDRALASTPPTEQAFITLKIVRAKTFLQKAIQGQEEVDVNISVDEFREIVTMISEGHGEWVAVHWHLGLALQKRFWFSADTKDLDESIACHRVAHRSCKRGDANYAHVHMHLGNALRESFYYGYSDMLDEAIVLLAEAEDIFSATPNHPNYRAALFNLGGALFTRFQTQRNGDDLDTAIENLSRAMTLPASAEEVGVPFGLATALSVRYNEHETLDDLERSVELFEIAAEQMPSKHLDREALCRSYGRALFKLSDHRDRLQNIENSIVFYREALGLVPPQHHDRPLTLIHLAESLRVRGQLRQDINDYDHAASIVWDAMSKVPEGSPLFCQICHEAAGMSMSIFSILQNPLLMEDGFRFYEKAAGYTHFRSFESVNVALEWVGHAERLDHASVLLAYKTCLGSLNQHLLFTASIKSRRAALLDKRWAKQTGTLATDASACAILRGELELAVELSEQGRGLLWSQMAQSRTPLDALRTSGEAGRALASDFERVSVQLEQRAIAQSSTSLRASRLTIEEAARQYQQLSRELRDIIASIRQQDGFQSFLDRPSFQTLQRAALGGPVILVNVSRRRCDALIVLHDAPPRLVPLPGTSLEDLTTLSAHLYRMLKATTRVGEEKIRERELVVSLRTLWDTVVRPIADELTGFLPRGSRIWWCPTSKLTSLPLHAAGPYRKGELNLANMYVSSYTPTLAALIRARHRDSSTESSTFAQPPPAFVAIGQAKPSFSNAPELQTVDAELTLVQSLLPPSMQFSALSGDASTADAALSALRTHAWAHMACHGHSNVEQPFDSSFALGDRKVTVLDVVGGRERVSGVVDGGGGGSKTDGEGDGNGDGDGNGNDDDNNGDMVGASSTTPEFAFLSACHTAVGDKQAPDEVIHLAAAMQFTGFRSVIGTMWAVDDSTAKEMVKAFYTHLFSPSLAGGGAGRESKKGGEHWDCTLAARALNRASKSVNMDAISFDQRIVFIHIGA